MAPLKIAIVGAGVGGPAAAIGLARNGHIVTLYERAASIGGVGFAFRITPNSDRCLKFLGIDILASGGVAADWSRFMTCDGRMFAEVQENGRPEEKGISAFAYRVCRYTHMTPANSRSSFGRSRLTWRVLRPSYKSNLSTKPQVRVLISRWALR